MQGAVVEALTAWRRDGTPDSPAAWLTTAAQRNALDLVRRRGRQDALARRAPEPTRVRRPRRPPTTGSALLFACCHPALAPEARLALTLRAVIGLTTPQIARAFLVNEQTLAQRIVRAKRKIVAAGIALTVPADEPDRAARRRTGRRLSGVQRGVRLLDRQHPGPRPRRRRGVAGRGGRHQPPRAGGGVGPGRPADDPARPRRRALRRPATWCCCATRTARAGTAPRSPRASAWSGPRPAGRPGRYQLQAAIAACHATARRGRRPTGCRSSPCTRCSPGRTPPRRPPQPRGRAGAARPAAGRARPGRRRGARRPARRLPPLPRHPGRAARPLGRDGRGRRGQPRALELTTNDAERRLLDDPAAPPPARRRVLSRSSAAVSTSALVRGVAASATQCGSAGRFASV